MQASRALTSEQVENFHEFGYISNIPVFSAGEMCELNTRFDELCGLLHTEETPYVMDGWERHNTWLYRLVMDARILDCIETLLGPNFYQWGSNIMCKMSREGLYIPWHQDMHDWPLSPPTVATVWLAFDDVDDENGCLRMIPGSHRSGRLLHHAFRPPPRGDNQALLPFFLEPSLVDEGQAVSLRLRAGEISLHSGFVIHGSEGNNSARRRCGFQICYAATEVKGDTSVRNANGDWSDFAIFMCRGVDEYHHNLHAEPPTTFGRGPRKEYRELKGVRYGQ